MFVQLRTHLIVPIVVRFHKILKLVAAAVEEPLGLGQVVGVARRLACLCVRVLERVSV